MQDFIEISNRNIRMAHEIIKELNIEKIWKEHCGQANLVGSVKTNLLMNNLDIDYHVYTEEFSIRDSFLTISEIANSQKIKGIQYVNMLESDDKCLEWHLTYIDREQRDWQIDIIHILKESKYVGKFERVADKINSVMNEKMREQILKIKYEANQCKEKVTGIEVYRAAIEDDVKSFEEFIIWYDKNKIDGIVEWEPMKI